MLQAFLIGNVGADAQLQAKDGRKFTTFRVAHNDVWTDQAGQEHRTSIWVGKYFCISSAFAMNDQCLNEGLSI